MAEATGQKRLVLCASYAAAAAGVAQGQTVALAQASVPGLTVLEADREADAASLARLAVWALRYTPLVAPDGRDGLVLDTTGADHLAGGEAALLSDLLTRLRKAKLSVRGALSSSHTLSWALARFGTGTDGPGRIVPPGGEEEAAAPLPVAALGMTPAQGSALRRLGLDRIGEVAAAPRSSLALRFGPDLTGRLDRLHARMPEPLTPIEAPELIRARLRLAEPIAHQAGIEAALERLTDELCAALVRRGLGVRILDLHYRRVDGEVQILRARAAASSRDPIHLRRLFKESLETIDPGFGIERLDLVAVRTGRLEARQRVTGEENPPPLEPLIDRIGARVGPGHVYRVAPTEADLPERSCRRTGPLAAPAILVWDRGPRPALLIEPPEPVEVLALLPDHPPRRFTWRGCQHQVTRADGPECMMAEWWRADEEVALTRDYYRVETQAGGRYWLFRARDEAAGTASWFVHGVFA
ncbi:DUF6504 family protein [Parvularcula dongshanensis]|uniref:DUF6504 family protein n=1 Tax=Parvularcula dongshanensis TaxID=1173995 RepID=UPI001C878D19